MSSFICSGQIQTTSVSGSWSAVVPTTTVTEAGNDYDASYILESNTNQTLIAVTTRKGSDDWRVSVSKIDILWDSRLILSVKRNTPPTGKLTGGTTYIPLVVLPTTFFQGRNDESNIPIQYKLTGISVLIPSGNYSTNVVYTFIDI